MYAVGAWAVVEVSATTFPLLGLPEWTARFVVVLALLGLPVALTLAWFFDVTPGGLVRTPDAAAIPPANGGSVSPAAGSPATAAPVATTPARGRAAGFFGLGMLVALVTVAAYFRFGPAGPSATRANIDSIAVLPFDDFSPARDQEYLGDGMAEELLDRLAKVEGLRVAARTSSFAFKNTNEDMKEIGRKLGVRSVLEGSVRRDGDQLRVTAQLIDAETGYHLWSDSYDRTISSVFAIQDEIANEIMAALRKQVMPTAIAGARAPASVRAHELYLQAVSRWHNRSDVSVRLAISLFEQAVAEDPEYAEAYAGLAQAYAVLPSLGDFPVQEAIAKGAGAAAQALALNAGLADAHAALGQIAQGFEWDLNSAERAYRRALTFNPGYATAHQWYAETLMMLGRYSEAQEHVDEAIALDPLSPSAKAVRAYLLAVRGQTDAALDAYRDVTTLHPDYGLALVNRMLLGIYAGRAADVDAVAMTVAEGDAEVAGALRALALARADATRRDAAIDALTLLDSAFPPSLAALFHAAAGRADAALERLAATVEQRADPNLPFILIHPLLEPLHDNPQFQELAGTVGVVMPG
jgi:serine/threonine-protein kinase